MNEDPRAVAEVHVRRMRRVIADAAADPAGAHASVERAVQQAAAREPMVEDETDRLLARARRVLYEAYLAMRGAGLLVPIVVGIQRARVRVRAHMTSVGVSSVSAGLESLGSFVAVTTMTALILSGPSIIPREATMAAPVRVHAPASVPQASPDVDLPPHGWLAAPNASASQSLSAEVRTPEAPTGTRAGATFDEEQDRIELRHDIIIEIDGREYVLSRGTKAWIYCDPDSIIKRAFCSAYRDAEDKAGMIQDES